MGGNVWMNNGRGGDEDAALTFREAVAHSQ